MNCETERTTKVVAPVDPLVSADQDMARRLTAWRDRILKSAATAIENHYGDGPVDDLSEEEVGFERGLNTAVDEICKLMNDASYFGR